MKFEVIVLGVGDAFSERYYPASMLLCYEGQYLAIDCPDRYRAVLRHTAERSGRPLDLSKINDFVITHVHGDHMAGIEMIGFYKVYREEGKRLKLHTTQEVRDVIWDERLKGSMGHISEGQEVRERHFEDFFNYSPLAWNGVNRIGPFSVKIRRTKHHVPTSALLVEAGGRKLGYSCDTAFDPDLIAFLEPADLIFHETNIGPAHTDLKRLLDLPDHVKTKMRLIHYPDWFDCDDSKIITLREGEILTV